MRILLWLYKSRKNHVGQSPIQVRITVNGEREQFTTGLYIEESRWNAIAQKAEGRGKAVANLNHQVDVIRQRLQEIYTQLSITEDIVDAADVRRMYFGETDRNVKLLEVFQIHNDKMKELIGIKYTPSTYTIYIGNKNILRRFIKKEYGISDIPLRRLTRKFIEDYAHYMQTVKKHSNATTHKNLQRLLKIIHFAVHNNWLERNPFVGYRFAVERKDIEYLTEAELSLLEKKGLPIARMARVRDFFVFLCYTGLSYVDLKTLKKEQISADGNGELWIRGHRAKTGTLYRVPLLPKAKEIIDKYKSDDDYLLRIPPNQTFNGYLKEIAAVCGIDKELTTHIGRRTFCTTVTLLNNVPLETIAAMVGHSSVKVTEQSYAKVLDEKVSRDVSGLRKKLK